MRPSEATARLTDGSSCPIRFPAPGLDCTADAGWIWTCIISRAWTRETHDEDGCAPAGTSRRRITSLAPTGHREACPPSGQSAKLPRERGVPPESTGIHPESSPTERPRCEDDISVTMQPAHPPPGTTRSSSSPSPISRTNLSSSRATSRCPR